MPRDNAAPLSAAAHRASAGAAESIPVLQVVNLARALGELKQAGIWLIGATQDADTMLYDADLKKPHGIGVRWEGKGLRGA